MSFHAVMQDMLVLRKEAMATIEAARRANKYASARYLEISSDIFLSFSQSCWQFSRSKAVPEY